LQNTVERDNGEADKPAFDVTQVELQPMSGYGVGHRGSYLSIGRTFDQLFARVAALRLGRPGMRMLALFHDDPHSMAPALLRSTAVVTGCAVPPPESGLALMTIGGGEFARLAHTGPYASMPSAYRWLFGSWIAASGRELGDGPVIEEYLNSPQQTAPHDLRTYLQVPLKPIEPLVPINPELSA
jgi:AraC family transcriptional regulator